jgi:tetratricopeptide (TPR) repeat protein
MHDFAVHRPVGRWLRLGLALACLLAGAADARADINSQKGWKQLQTPNFEILGNAGDRDLRMVAERLEMFREAMAALFPTMSAPSDTRIRVLVFRNHKTYDPFKPLYEGKPAAIGGYFLGGDDINHISLTVENRDDNFELIQHEYVHLLTAGSVGTLPPWVSEGIAEYYSSFKQAPDGRRVHIGVPHLRHVLLLRERFLPLATLVSAGRDSEHYNERNKKSTFYAESWALIHYLLLGNGQKYSPKAGAFVGALAEGRSLEQAARDVLQVEAPRLEQELRQYVNRANFLMQTAVFDEKLTRLEKLPVVPFAESEAHAVLGDLLQRMRRDDEADAQLTRALSLDPESPVAHAALAQVRLRQDRPADAREHLERATRSPAATFVTHYQLAALLQSPGGEDTATVARQETALRRAVELNPRHAESWHLLGVLKGRARETAAEALTLVQKAVDIAPGRERYLLTMAYLYANAQNTKVALSLSRSLADRASDDAVREHARTLHERLAAFERHLAEAAAVRAAHAEAPAAPAAAATPDDAVTFDGDRGAAALIPVFREVQPNEVRRAGFLIAIDCGPSGIVLRVDTDGRPVALKARRFEDVEFITYRDDLKGAVACGRRPTLDAVYFTWRGGARWGEVAAAQPVAIEFLPKGFVPPRQDPLPD